MKVLKEALYILLFGTALCLTSCGKNNNQSEGVTDSMEDTTGTQSVEPIDTEMDSVVSPDTVMPAL